MTDVTNDERVNRALKYLEEATDNQSVIATVATHLGLLGEIAKNRGDAHSYLEGYFMGMVEIASVPEQHRKTLIGAMAAVMARKEVPLESLENDVANLQDIVREVYAGIANAS